MNKKLLVKILLPLGVLCSTAYFLLFTTPNAKAHSVKIVKDAVKIELNKNIVSVKSKGGGGESLTFCSFATAECAKYGDIWSRPPSNLSEEFGQEKIKCLEEGCVVWGIPQTKPATLEVSSEEATSLLNGYKPDFMPLNNIKIRFESNRAHVEFASLLPIAPGLITLTAEQTGPKQIKIKEADIGRLPLPSSAVSFLEQRINNYLGYQWFGCSLNSFQFADGKVIIDGEIPPQIIASICTQNGCLFEAGAGSSSTGREKSIIRLNIFDKTNNERAWEMSRLGKEGFIINDRLGFVESQTLKSRGYTAYLRESDFKTYAEIVVKNESEEKTILLPFTRTDPTGVAFEDLVIYLTDFDYLPAP